MSRRVRRHNLAALAVLALGLTQLVGFVTGSRTLRGIGAATQAAPLPKVFTSHRGMETFASDFELVYQLDGQEVWCPITPDVYQGLRGPYNRRNVYGAVLSYGPLLPRRLLDPVLRYGLEPGGPLHSELGLPDHATDVRVAVHVKTRGREQTCVLTPAP